MYTGNKKPILVAHISYRGDMFKYIATFKKRKKKIIWANQKAS
jgi:hypothetical protein